MAPNCRGKNWPVTDAICKIQTALTYENETNLLAVSANQGYGEVSLKDRDRAVKSLKFLRWWCKLPPAVFFTATNILDRFLTKMKVQRRYLFCLVISCLSIAAKFHHHVIDSKSLVTISQSKFSFKDMERMSDIVYSKLDIGLEKQLINVFNYLDQFLRLIRAVAVQLEIDSFFNIMLKRAKLISQLEVIMCSSQCASVKPSIIALALIQIGFEQFLLKEVPFESPHCSARMSKMSTLIVDLQLICLIAPAEFISCHENIKNTLQDYYSNVKLEKYHFLKCHSSKPIYTVKPYWCELNSFQPILEE